MIYGRIHRNETGAKHQTQDDGNGVTAITSEWNPRHHGGSGFGKIRNRKKSVLPLLQKQGRIGACGARWILREIEVRKHIAKESGILVRFEEMVSVFY